MSRRLAWVLVGLAISVLISCKTGAPEEPTPSTATPPDAGLPAVTWVEQDVHVQIGTLDVPAPGAVLDTGAACTVQVTFSGPVKKETAEKALRSGFPPSAAVRFEWQADRSVWISVPAGGSFTVTATGTELLEGGKILRAPERSIRRPTEKELRFFSPEQVLAGKEDPEATRVQRMWVNGFQVSPSGQTLLLHEADPLADHGPLPSLLDLVSGELRYLPLPPEDRTYSFAGWLPDGQILLAGRAIWICPESGGPCREITGSYARTVALAPSGQQLALWANEQIHIMDLATGTVRALPGAFPRPSGSGRLAIGWSDDSQYIAITKPGRSGDLPPSIIIVRASDGVAERTVPGVYLVGWHGGSMFGWQPPGALQSDGRGTLIAFDASGKATGTFPGNALPSPDGRFVVWETGPGAVTLADRLTGAVRSAGIPHSRLLWTSQGLLLAISDRGE